MKLTVEIPEALYRRAKIRAVEQGGTLRELVMSALKRELSGTDRVGEEPAPYFARRALDPAFEALREAGAFRGGPDSTDTISNDRDAHESAYFDTAFLFRLYWDDAGHEAVRSFAATCGGIACATHGRAEFLSTAHRKVREGAERTTLTALLDQFALDSDNGGIAWLPLTEGILNRVEDVYRQAPAGTFLRAADALHLATAAHADYRVLYSNDRHLLAAAPLFGVEGVDLTRT